MLIHLYVPIRVETTAFSYLLVNPPEIYPTILPPITTGCHICIIVYLLNVSL
jgi:hypothetical protein